MPTAPRHFPLPGMHAIFAETACAGAPGDTCFKVWRALLAPDKAVPDQALLAGSLRALRQSGDREWLVILSRGRALRSGQLQCAPVRAARVWPGQA